MQYSCANIVRWEENSWKQTCSFTECLLRKLVNNEPIWSPGNCLASTLCAMVFKDTFFQEKPWQSLHVLSWWKPFKPAQTDTQEWNSTVMDCLYPAYAKPEVMLNDTFRNCEMKTQHYVEAVVSLQRFWISLHNYQFTISMYLLMHAIVEQGQLGGSGEVRKNIFPCPFVSSLIVNRAPHPMPVAFCFFVPWW